MTRTIRTLTATLAAALGGAAEVHAGWDNVFQAACFHCKRPRITSYYAPPPAPPVRAERMPDIVNCYYEPITVMKPQVFTEEVKVPERRSYYESVTEYTTRSYYNHATCREETVCVPRTSLVRKDECNYVTKYIERTRMVPVQEQRKICERTPVTTYTQYGPTTRNVECDACQLPGAGGPSIQSVPGSPPVATPERIEPQPGVQGGLSSPRRVQPTPPSRYAGPVNSRTVARSSPVQGEVVLADKQTPRPKTKVIFLSAADMKTRVEATSDDFGQFDTTVPTGEWHVYLGTGTGKATFMKTVTIDDAGKNFQVVSR